MTFSKSIKLSFIRRQKIFEAMHNMDMSKSKVIKTLFLLHGIYRRLNLSKRSENQPGLGFSIKEHGLRT